MSEEQKKEQLETNEVKETENNDVSERQPQETSEDIAKQATQADEKSTVDVEKVTADVEKSVIGRIMERFGLTEKQAEQKAEQPDYKQQIQQQVQAELEKRDKLKQQEQQKTQQDYENQVQQITKTWHTEYDQLVQQGKAPKIKDANDKNDPGIKARRALIQTIGEIIKSDKQNGVSRTPSVFEAYTLNPRAIRGVAGADLPISGQTPSSPEGDFKYSDIRSSSFEDIVSQG